MRINFVNIVNISLPGGFIVISILVIAQGSIEIVVTNGSVAGKRKLQLLAFGLLCALQVTQIITYRYLEEVPSSQPYRFSPASSNSRSDPAGHAQEFFLSHPVSHNPTHTLSLTFSPLGTAKATFSFLFDTTLYSVGF